VNWCKNNLQNIRWSTNGYQPPLPFADNTFDLIYAISVFTHLDEKLQHMWLGELQRIAKPGAIIILSVLGEYTIGMLDSSSQDKIHAHGFMFVTGARGKLKLNGLPDFYQTAYHTQKYIYREWSAYFDIVRYIERGIGNFQDAVILRKIGIDFVGYE
jgi:ubiquinone/menaquinone biosynthesis C-methylase UbiE